MRNNDKYFRVVTDERNGVGEIFLYGFIGQNYWWGDEDMKEESITDLSFVRALREMERQYDRIDIRINSPGGSVLHGDPIITAMRSSPAEIHTYVDGMAASMAADIWLAGKVRHMASNSKLMIHSTSTIAFGTAQDMRSAAEELDKFDETAIATFAAVTGKDKEEIRAAFYDYRDHWLTADEAKDWGLIEDVDTYETQPLVNDPEKMTHAQLMQRFARKAQEAEWEKYLEKAWSEKGIAEMVREQLRQAQGPTGPDDDEDEPTDPGARPDEVNAEKEAAKMRLAKAKLLLSGLPANG